MVYWRGGGGTYVLRDKVPRARMQTPRQKAADEKVVHCVCAEEADDSEVEGALHGDVEEVQLRDGDAHDQHGPEGVEEDLEGREEGFAEDGVEEEGFKAGGEVCV